MTQRIWFFTYLKSRSSAVPLPVLIRSAATEHILPSIDQPDKYMCIMKLALPTTFITALLLSAVHAYDADDFKGKFVGTDTVGIHGDHGIEEDGKTSTSKPSKRTTKKGTIEGTFFYEGEHEDDPEDVVGIWFEDGRFHLIDTEGSGTIDGRLHDEGGKLYATATHTEPGTSGKDGLAATAHRLDKK